MSTSIARPPLDPELKAVLAAVHEQMPASNSADMIPSCDRHRRSHTMSTSSSPRPVSSVSTTASRVTRAPRSR